MVRKLLKGRFENTAFVVFDPSGTKHLSRTGRSPGQGLSTGRSGPGRKASNEVIIKRMQEIAADYVSSGNAGETQLQDFHSFRQALNVASADQRLLLFVNADEESRPQAVSSLQSVFSDTEVLGKFHLDFADAKTDAKWDESIKGANGNPGLIIIRSGEYGIDGTVVKQLELKSSPEQIKSALLSANEEFSMLEDRKSYSSHIKKGRRQGINFENEIPFGEDKDGDGKIDRRRKRSGRNR